MAPPGYPKIRSTFSLMRIRTIASAPVIRSVAENLVLVSVVLFWACTISIVLTCV